MRRWVLAVLAAFSLAGAQAQDGEGVDAGARAVVERLNAVVLETMKSAETLGYEGRRSTFEAVLPDIYDFRRMAGVAVGRTAWRALNAEQKDAYVDAFGALSAATYASRFRRWNDNAFVIDGVEPGPRGTLVRTRLTRPNDEDVALDYLARTDSETGETRLVDVLYDGGVSELAQKRSEYSTTFRQGGFDALIAGIEKAITAQAPSD